jgi:diguanylate cyclase (GGDEF)-like protein
VPLRGLGISVLALLTAAVVSLAWPDVAQAYAGHVWTLALVPIFLLSYYRGWRGAAIAAGSAMVVFTLVEVVVVQLMGRTVDWRLYGTAVLLLGVVTVGTGWVTELLHRERRDAVRLAYEDPLTLLPSRRALDFFLSTQVAAARRGQELSLVFFDLDQFKSFNDRHGHAAGDRFLYRVGAVLSDNTREMNLAGRYGGEEFLAVLPGEDAEGARVYAERVREEIAKLDAGEEGPTISAGISSFRDEVEDASELLTRADQALYAAKARGGDRVRVYADAREAS